MPKDSSGNNPPSNIRNFPPRKPRYTAQDNEDFTDIRKLQMMNRALGHLARMHGDLHGLFREVVQHDDAWPFFSVRQLQAYVEKSDFDMLTHNDNLLLAARTAVLGEVKANMAELGKALLAHTGLTLSETSGLDLRQDSYLLKRREADLEVIRDVIDHASAEEQAVLSRVARVTQHGLRTMFNLGSPLSMMGQQAIGSLHAAKPNPSSDPHDPTHVAPRRHHLHLSEHWLRVITSQLHLMKLDLLADYTEDDRSKRQGALFEGALVQVTEPQADFIATDAQSHSDLGNAQKALHLALLA